MGSISISWSALAQVAGISLAFVLGIVIAFSLGVIGLSRAATAREQGTGSAHFALLTSLAFAACAAAVGYGLYLLIPQFH